MSKLHASWDRRVEKGAVIQGIRGIRARSHVRVMSLLGETLQEVVAVVVDHALGVLLVEVETITTRIAQTTTEGKRHTKLANVGEAVEVGEVSRVDSKAVHLNHLIRIKLQVGTNNKEIFSLSNINHPTVQANHIIRGSREAESFIEPR